MFARISPDGKQIAVTGQYAGNTEVYLMPAEGGVPKRLTYTATLGRDDVADRMGPNNVVLGWKHDGKSIVFRSRMHSFNDFLGQLYLVPVEGGPPEPLPLPRGGFCSYSPDDSKLVYNRVFREFRTWKRYRGGMADDQVSGRGGIKDVSKSVSGFAVSPDGKRALFTARGDVFTVPAQTGPTRDLTNSPGAHERDAKWSPDGKLVAFIGDSSGEDEIY